MAGSATSTRPQNEQEALDAMEVARQDTATLLLEQLEAWNHVPNINFARLRLRRALEQLEQGP